SVMWPRVGGIRPMIARASVDLPQPDSPTRPRHSPGFTSSVTPSTAFSVWTPPARALPTLKWTARSSRASRSAMVMAPHQTVRRQWRDPRRHGEADVARARAARVEAAARWIGLDRRHDTGDLAQFLLAAPRPFAESRQGIQQALGVGMLWRGEDRSGRLHLDDAAGIHRGDALGHLRDQAEVVASHQDGGAIGGAQLGHQVD